MLLCSNEHNIPSDLLPASKQQNRHNNGVFLFFFFLLKPSRCVRSGVGGPRLGPRTISFLSVSIYPSPGLERQRLRRWMREVMGSCLHLTAAISLLPLPGTRPPLDSSLPAPSHTAAAERGYFKGAYELGGMTAESVCIVPRHRPGEC